MNIVEIGSGGEDGKVVFGTFTLQTGITTFNVEGLAGCQFYVFMTKNSKVISYQYNFGTATTFGVAFWQNSNDNVTWSYTPNKSVGEIRLTDYNMAIGSAYYLAASSAKQFSKTLVNLGGGRANLRLYFYCVRRLSLLSRR